MLLTYLLTYLLTEGRQSASRASARQPVRPVQVPAEAVVQLRHRSSDEGPSQAADWSSVSTLHSPRHRRRLETSCTGGRRNMLPPLQVSDLLTLKVVSESLVTWPTSVPILVFLGLSVLDLGPMYATDRQIDVRQHHCLMPPPRWRGIITG